MFSKHCGYQWPGTLAPGHWWTQRWLCTHAFPLIRWLTSQISLSEMWSCAHNNSWVNCLIPTFRSMQTSLIGTICILLMIPLKFVPNVQINNIPALVKIMDWCQPGDKSLSEPIVVSLLMHICITWPQWVDGDYTVYTSKYVKCLSHQ